MPVQMLFMLLQPDNYKSHIRNHFTNLPDSAITDFETMVRTKSQCCLWNLFSKPTTAPKTDCQPSSETATATLLEKTTKDMHNKTTFYTYLPTKKTTLLFASGATVTFVATCALLQYCNRTNPLESFFTGTGTLLTAGTTKAGSCILQLPGVKTASAFLNTNLDYYCPKKI